VEGKKEPGKNAGESCHTMGCGKRGKKCDCNKDCAKFADCCEDYLATCSSHFVSKPTRPPPTPAPQETCAQLGCGGRGKKCACNEHCRSFSDCCEDFETHCRAKTPKNPEEVLEQEKALAEQMASQAAAWGPTHDDDHETCKDLGCGVKGVACGCTSDCKYFDNCCADYSDHCLHQHGQRNSSVFPKALKSAISAKKLRETCHEIGCDTMGVHCACTKECANFNNCCEDYSATCAPQVKQPSPRHRAKQPSPRPRARAKKDCEKAKNECNKAIDWAMRHGIYEHPEWYFNITSHSPRMDFWKSLSEAHRSRCDDVCEFEM